MRRHLRGIAVVLMLVPTKMFAEQASPTASATDLPSAQIQAELKTPFTGTVADRLLSLADAGGYNVAVAVVRRPGGAGVGALSHDKITEIYYILKGSGTQITGGTIVDAKPNPASATIGPSVSGSGVQNGRDSNLGPGDIQIIPPGVPHVWRSIDAGGIEYLVFRVDPEHVLSIP